MPAKTTSSISTHKTSDSPGANETTTSRTLSGGQIAGITIGTMVFTGLIAALILIQVRRRREVSNGVTNHQVDPFGGKPELPNNGVSRAELEPAANELVPELEGHALYPEMDGRTEPVEAPHSEISHG
ncbi:hypothetical protein PG984_011592 [Apiospora sp. TS-2023a]